MRMSLGQPTDMSYCFTLWPDVPESPGSKFRVKEVNLNFGLDRLQKFAPIMEITFD